MNLYDLMNAELERMHKQRDFYLQEAMKYRSTGNHIVTNNFNNWFTEKFYDLESQINDFRQEIKEQFKNHDQKIQEKIAELALTDIK